MQVDMVLKKELRVLYLDHHVAETTVSLDIARV